MLRVPLLPGSSDLGPQGDVTSESGMQKAPSPLPVWAHPYSLEGNGPIHYVLFFPSCVYLFLTSGVLKVGGT